MIRTICYVSTAVQSLTEQGLSKLYEQVIENNKEKYVTGVLLFSDGNFMQIMEGEDDVLETLYQKIREDDRHHHLFKLVDHFIDERIFEYYSNGFTIVTDEKAIFKLNLYLNWLQDNFSGDTSNLAQIMQPFLKYV